jgi:hypothetical protein
MKVESKINYPEEKVDDVLMMAHNELNSGSEMVWYLNIGASNYLSGYNNLFVEMKEIVGTISFGNASKVEVKGNGNIKFIQKNEGTRIIEDV